MRSFPQGIFGWRNFRNCPLHITLYVTIGHNDISLCYVENAEVQAVAGEAKDAVVSPIEKLEKQDKRNKEIRFS